MNVRKSPDPTIRRALISVSDKTGLVPFARFLTAEFKVKILSTGGTAKALWKAGVSATAVSEYTGFPECFDGRVKTLHPKIHGGLLFLRGNPEHEARAKELGIEPIDLLVVNLYPFEQTLKKPGVTDEEAIEQIDIGGPAGLRSAAKNHKFVTVVYDPNDYSLVQNQMVVYRGRTTYLFRRFLAGKAFRETSRYDKAIADYLVGEQYHGAL